MRAAQGPPLDPTSDDARRWLVEELSKPGYSTQPSLWERFQEWLQNLFGQIRPGSASASWMLWILLAVLALVLAIIVIRLLRPERRRRGTRVGAVLDDSGRSAQEYRRDARAALQRGDFDTALLDSVRAIAAGASERVILEDSPGRTANELGQELRAAFPGHESALLALMRDFDGIRYGQEHASAPQASAAIDLESTLTDTAPVRTATEVALR